MTESLTGNREAFGQIVTRYQTLICSLAYSATGSFSQSQDLAQETFVTAWKKLSELREPGKIARLALRYPEKPRLQNLTVAREMNRATLAESLEIAQRPRVERTRHPPTTPLPKRKNPFCGACWEESRKFTVNH